MSWESSIVYSQLVNEAVRARLGGLHSADCLLRSVDFADVEELPRDGRWGEAAELLAGEDPALAAAGRAPRLVYEHRAQGCRLDCCGHRRPSRDGPVPALDTTVLHAKKAVDMAFR